MNTELQRLRSEYAYRDSISAISERYSLFDDAYLFMIQQRQREIIRILRKAQSSTVNEGRLLEIGCGKGNTLIEFGSYGMLETHSFGIDILLERAILAAKRNQCFRIANADGQYLPYKSDTFNVVIQFTVFSSILEREIKVNIANEMLRVLNKTHGIIIWYDFWLNPLNSHTKGIRKSEIRELFPSCNIIFRKITLAPPIARRLVRISWLACLILERMSIFSTHYLSVICPRSPNHSDLISNV